MSKETSNQITGGIAVALLGALLWWAGLGLISLLLWGLIACALVPDRLYPRSRKKKAFDAEVHELAAGILTDRLKADEKTYRKREMQEWDEDYLRLERPELTTAEIKRQAKAHMAVEAARARQRAEEAKKQWPKD